MSLDDETRDQVHRFMLRIAGGLSRQEIADRVANEFPDLWKALRDDLMRKWCWEELRSLRRADDQLPLVGLFPPKGSQVAGADAIVKPIGEWDRFDFAQKWLQYDHNGRASFGMRDAIAAAFAKAFPGEQLEMFIRGLGD
jgi:hypothetical protein